MLAIIRSGERRRTRRERNISKGENSAVGDESASEPRLLGNTEYFSKQIPAEGDYLPPIMWKEPMSHHGPCVCYQTVPLRCLNSAAQWDQYNGSQRRQKIEYIVLYNHKSY
ncbi:hypothetical protein Y032_0317g2319 [Ancylostoma ceylanicum]|uniref:Uncharacterized protein n=1 Tax=Ancylostoma ceylanicum TaxID=53326 RepID=A0A016S1L2_9BILA|nr:hypothetical protein Y032_0317g2319 [Ancylostoma ceylanicum]